MDKASYHENGRAFRPFQRSGPESHILRVRSRQRTRQRHRLHLGIEGMSKGTPPGGTSVGLTVQHILSILEGHERDGTAMRRPLRDNLI
jgi:hypothetical protein